MHTYRRTILSLPTVTVARVVIPLVLPRYIQYLFSAHALSEREISGPLVQVHYFRETQAFAYVKRLTTTSITKGKIQ